MEKFTSGAIDCVKYEECLADISKSVRILWFWGISVSKLIDWLQIGQQLLFNADEDSFILCYKIKKNNIK